MIDPHEPPGIVLRVGDAEPLAEKDAEARSGVDDISVDARARAKNGQFETLLAIASTSMTPFRTPEGRPWARVQTGDVVRTLPIEVGGALSQDLSLKYYEAAQRAPSREAVRSAIETLQARALGGVDVYPVHLRVAERDGRLYINLHGGRVVEISAVGWRVVQAVAAPFFYEPLTARPLPAPEKGGDLRSLSELLNFGGEDDRMLVAFWLLAALRPAGPFPVLIITGPPGSAKTSAANCLQQILDPAGVQSCSLPRSERDLYVIAAHRHVLSFDNLSEIAPDQSDALCRLATGGGFIARQLFTDAAAASIKAERPVILNGIGSFASRGDLLDRAVCIELAPIADEARRTVRELERAFERAHPQILGALCDAAAAALARYPDVEAQALPSPRMADFANWCRAGELELAYIGAFDVVSARARERRLEDDVEAEPIAVALVELLERQRDQVWLGTATELQQALALSGWGVGLPRAPNALSGAIKRARPILERAGVRVERRKADRGTVRLIEVRRT